MVKERANFVNDLWDLSSYFFEAPGEYDEKAVKKQWKEQTPSILTKLQKILETTPSFESDELESVVKAWITAEELSFGMIMAPLRLVIVGALKGPHIFDILSLIGKEESIKRIQIALERLP